MELNKYFDFLTLLKDAYSSFKESLLEYNTLEEYITSEVMYNPKDKKELARLIDCYNNIIRFFENNYYDMEIDQNESLIEHEYSSCYIYFTKDFNDANESCTQSTTADVFIAYNYVRECFIEYKYEQG